MNKYVVLSVTFVLGGVVGGFLVPRKVVTETKIVEVERKTEEKQQDKNTKERTTKTEKKNPDGSSETTTVTEKDTSVTTDVNRDVTKSSTIDSFSLSERVGGLTTVSVMGSVDVTKPSGYTLGLHVTKPILGPVSIGVFGFQDGRVGASVGLTF